VVWADPFNALLWQLLPLITAHCSVVDTRTRVSGLPVAVFIRNVVAARSLQAPSCTHSNRAAWQFDRSETHAHTVIEMARASRQVQAPCAPHSAHGTRLSHSVCFYCARSVVPVCF
jgi:hypothetical protein